MDTSIQKRFLNRKELSQWLGVNIKTIEKLESNGILNPKRFPQCRRVFFDLREVGKVLTLEEFD